ncbi:MAG: hypothetical protein K9N34_04485 [Candidatus Marinimicrobia bacterium]|nr:hypothetical protein [Candidatus Neomarinimicrobiota bacterium]MCF7839566.1 hypothetical protein [Candidatus Neomarinimicrobiota bacterium]
MFSIVYFGLGFAYLYGSNLILHRIERDYANYGVLRDFTAGLQLLIFAVHLLFVLLSFKSPDWPLSWPPLSPAYWAWIVGFILMISGGFILSSACKTFGTIDRILGRQVTVLKKEGPYRWSRNPQVVGYGMILLGITFVWFTDYTLIAVILYAPVAHRLVLIEEAHLGRIFKEKYSQYQEETVRYFGRKPLMTKVREEKYSLGNP